MKKEIKKIDLNFQHSIKKYSYSHKSKHWAYMHRKKKKLLNVNYLENFRNNNLSYGLDDQFYKKKEFLKNFIDLKKECGPCIEKLDHAYLNEIPGLENPTSENIAIWIWENIEKKLCGLLSVEVQETCNSGCIYDGR